MRISIWCSLSYGFPRDADAKAAADRARKFQREADDLRRKVELHTNRPDGAACSWRADGKAFPGGGEGSDLLGREVSRLKKELQGQREACATAKAEESRLRAALEVSLQRLQHKQYEAICCSRPILFPCGLTLSHTLGRYLLLFFSKGALDCPRKSNKYPATATVDRPKRSSRPILLVRVRLSKTLGFRFGIPLYRFVGV